MYLTSDGRVDNVHLLHPPGMGLDEIAHDIVQTWLFRPATHNKEPVAIEMNVEAAVRPLLKMSSAEQFYRRIPRAPGAVGALKKIAKTHASCFTLLPAMTRKISFLLLAVLLFQTAIAHADSLKDALNDKYKDQILALRSPLTKGDQKYDSAGHSLNTAKSSGWLLYGGISVKKIDLSPDTLRVEGNGATSYMDKRIGKLIVMPFGKARNIDIHLDQPLNSVDEADAIMAQVFFLGPDAVDHIRPEFRRADDNTPGLEIYKVSQHEFRPASANTAGSTDNNDKVLPPRPTYTPIPDFSAQARHAKFQGTVILGIVIDKAGKISRIRLDRPLGMGLDENAMEGVKQWRFSPAMRNGEPVAVAMSIEVSFNLY